jgi:hypothetical protein
MLQSTLITVVNTHIVVYTLDLNLVYNCVTGNKANINLTTIKAPGSTA